MTAMINEQVALRLALAAKAIPEMAIDQFIFMLINLCGEPLSEKKFRGLTPKLLREAFAGANNTIERSQVNQVLAVLKADEACEMRAPDLPSQRPLNGPILKLAVSSNHLEQVDGHFGSCLRFLIYQVSGDGYQLCEVRNVEKQLSGEARTLYLLELISDCQLLATLSVGGPAAARLNRANILPLKQLTPTPAQTVLERLTLVMQKPLPRWLDKLLNGAASAQAKQCDCGCDSENGECSCDGDCNCNCNSESQTELSRNKDAKECLCKAD